MIAQLGRLHPQSLSVIARTSVMRYKKTDTPIDQIGRELGVDYVLEGSARREGDRIRISAELIQVRDQTQLWADVCERDLAGLLALQHEVAQRVANALALKLLPAEQARLTNVRPVNPEAHDAYLKGSHYWYKLTPGDLDTAQKYLELALQKDPNYAPAHAGMALVWGGRNQMGIVPPGEAAPKAKEAALKAVALDDTLADAHYALAVVKTWHDWDIPAADAGWRRAIERNPNFPDARGFYSHYLHIVGRRDEAMTQCLGPPVRGPLRRCAGRGPQGAADAAGGAGGQRGGSHGAAHERDAPGGARVARERRRRARPQHALYWRDAELPGPARGTEVPGPAAPHRPSAESPLSPRRTASFSLLQIDLLPPRGAIQGRTPGCAGGIVLAPGRCVVDRIARALAEEPVVMWRMRRADGLFTHLLVGCQGSGAWAAWFLNDRPLGVRDFDDLGSAISFSERMQAQNWTAGWRLVEDA